MTIFGTDISSFQRGLDLGRLQHAAFVIAKVTEGTYYVDAEYEGWRVQARALGRLFAWYHFLSGEDAHEQAAHTLAHVGDTSLPGMLDAEPQEQTGYRPTMAQILAYIDAAHAVGLNLRLLYLPRWYWEQIGSPDLGQVTARGVWLVASSYAAGDGSPVALYPGDGAAGWRAYGGAAPLLLQFTSTATDGGRTLDYNAFRGDLGELERALYPTIEVPGPGTEEDDVATFSQGEIHPGDGAVTMIATPPANTGVNWGPVWFSLGSDFGNPVVRVAALVHGHGWVVKDNVQVPAAGDRVNPFGGPLPDGTQKISVTRRSTDPGAPLAYLIEARSK